MPGHATRSTLLDRLRSAGDQESWREFDATYRELIRRYCHQRGLQTADAEDVQQIVMTSLARTMPSFTYSRATGRFRDYLGRVVRNAIHKHVVRRRRTPDPMESDVLDGAGERDDDGVWEDEWMRHHFRRALHKARSCFDAQTLRIFEHLLAGESAKTLATSFEVSESAVYKVKHRVRDRLRSLIAEQIRDEEFQERGP